MFVCLFVCLFVCFCGHAWYQGGSKDESVYTVVEVKQMSCYAMRRGGWRAQWKIISHVIHTAAFMH